MIPLRTIEDARAWRLDAGAAIGTDDNEIVVQAVGYGAFEVGVARGF